MTNVPIRYLPKRLTHKDRKQYSSALRKSRKAYKKGKYITRKKVKSFKSKPSSHVTRAQKLYGIDKITASPTLAKKTGCSVKTLKKIVQKGQGAYYSSGSRPNQTAHSWGRARLASAITGGKAAAVDLNILTEGCKDTSKALKLAKQARKKHKYGTRRVPKTKMTGGTPHLHHKHHQHHQHHHCHHCHGARDGVSGCRTCCRNNPLCVHSCMVA